MALMGSGVSGRRVYKTNLHRNIKQKLRYQQQGMLGEAVEKMVPVVMASGKKRYEAIKRKMWGKLQKLKWGTERHAHKQALSVAKARMSMTLDKQVEHKGRGMAILHTITKGAVSNTRCTGDPKDEAMAWKLRKLKFGMVPNAKLMKLYTLRDAEWRSLPHSEKHQMITCDCKHGGVQDMCHLVFECGWYADTVDTILKETVGIIKGKAERGLYMELNRDEQIVCSMSGLQQPRLLTGTVQEKREQRNAVNVICMSYGGSCTMSYVPL